MTTRQALEELSSADLHRWAEQHGVYAPATARGTAYLRTLAQIWTRLHPRTGSDAHHRE